MYRNDKYILPFFVPDEGCPFRCIFCNQKRITGEQAHQSDDQIRAYIDKYLGYFKDKTKKIMICFYGGSFTGISIKRQKRYLEIAGEYIKRGKICQVGLSTRPDYINPDILIMLKQHNVSIIEIGAQSLVDDVLLRSKRGHTYADIKKAAEMIKENDFKCGLQLLPGLPGETNSDRMLTIERTVKIKPDFVRIYPLLVLKDTKIEKMFLNGEYIPLTLDAAVGISLNMLNKFIENDIDVIRIGLQNTDQISPDSDVIAGPFHESFGQLVLSEYILQNIIKEAKGYDKISNVDIYVGKGMISAARGFKNKNIELFSKLLNTDDIRIHETENNRYYIKLNVNKGEA